MKNHAAHGRRTTTALIGLMLTLLVSSCDSKDDNALFKALLFIQLQAPQEYYKSPYLIYTGDNTSMAVQWQMTVTETCTFEWGETEGVYTYSTETTENSSASRQHLHQSTITGITPGTTYYYRVTSEAGMRTGSYTHPNTSATNLKFIAYGDSRSYPDIHEQVTGAMLDLYGSDPDYRTFLLSMGDLVGYGDNEDQWQDEYFSASMVNLRSITSTIPFISTVGNHDLGLSMSRKLFKKYFTYPFVSGEALYWSFDYGPAHFTLLDPYAPLDEGSVQLAWIEDDLAAAETAGRPWKFVVTHKPGWSAGGGHENSTTIQTYVEPLCELYGVDIVFSGHNHYYSRAEVPYASNPSKFVQHITTGGGSGPLHTPDDTYPNIVKAEKTNEFCAVNIAGNKLTLKAIRIDGSEIETLTIMKP